MIILNTSFDVGSIKIWQNIQKNHLNKGNALISAHCCGLGVLIISHCRRDGKKKSKKNKNQYE